MSSKWYFLLIIISYLDYGVLVQSCVLCCRRSYHQSLRVKISTFNMQSKELFNPLVDQHLHRRSFTDFDQSMNAKDDNINKKLKSYMLDSIKWYKSTLSPMMPPNCRFLPTCSSYGIQAIEEYGPWKGGILTIWRIMRCTPFGGFGYDPPTWPPPNYFAGSNGKM
mmetsp:Transcript_348/g.339  ORF Transcript_348/g.339 Transcript_348/m.339 type:complete len:165 (+) Transcript_348:108-602(+)